MFFGWKSIKEAYSRLPKLRGLVSSFIFVIAIFVTVTNCHALGFSNLSFEEPGAECCSLHEIEETSANVTFGVLGQSYYSKFSTALPVALPIPESLTKHSSELIVDTGREQRLAWVWAKSLPFSKYKGFPTYFFATRSA